MRNEEWLMGNELISTQVLAAMQAMSGWEVVAVMLAIAYILLAVKERIECWYAAFACTAIYTFLFWNVNLLMESALQIYYLVMAVYGWWQWRRFKNSEENLPIQTWSSKQHSLSIIGIGVVSIFSGYLLSENTSAALPYLDSFTTWASVFTTYMVTKKVLENWIYWVVIDAVSIYLYIDRSLYLTAILFILYVSIAIYGYWQWLQHYRRQIVPCLNPA